MDIAQNPGSIEKTKPDEWRDYVQFSSVVLQIFAPHQFEYLIESDLPFA